MYDGFVAAKQCNEMQVSTAGSLVTGLDQIVLYSLCGLTITLRRTLEIGIFVIHVIV